MQLANESFKYFNISFHHIYNQLMFVAIFYSLEFSATKKMKIEMKKKNNKMIIQLTLSMVFILHIAIWNSLVPAKKKIQLWLTWYKHIILVINCVLFTSLFCGFRPIDQSSGGCVCVYKCFDFQSIGRNQFQFFSIDKFSFHRFPYPFPMAR